MEDHIYWTEETGRAEALRRIARCAAAREEALDLSGLMLRELPEEVYALTWLRALDLGPDREAMKRPDYGPNEYNQGKGRNALAAVPEHLAGLKSLTTLDLSGNGIGPDGARHLAGLTALQSLVLWNNAIGPDGAQALAGLTALQSLDLSRNGIGPDGARHLAGLTALTTLHLTDNRIGPDGAQALAGLKSLTTLDLSGNGIGPDGARHLAGLTALQSLDLRHNGIGPDGARHLAGLTALQSLVLWNNAIGPDGAQALAGLTALTTLNLWDNGIGDDGARHLAGLTALQSLNLYGNGIGPDGARHLADLKSLTTLDLWGNGIGDDGARHLAGLTALQSLDLRHNGIGPDGAKALAGLKSLTTLDLWDNAIGPDGAKALAGLKSLTTLDLTGNAIGPDGAQALAGLTALTTLHLAGNGLGPDGAKALAGLTALQSLDLRHNGIGDDGARHLAGLTALQSLDLSGNGIGPDGARHLAGLKSLTTLNLSRNGIGPDGAKALAGLTALQSLDLSGNGIGDDGARHLAGLTALQSLDLSGNGEIDAEPLYELRQLKSLNASSCAFPGGFDLGRMSFLLEDLILHETRIPGVPPEVLSQDFHSDNCIDRLLSHEEDLKAGAAEITDVKFMILGNGRVGKTQIVRRLSLPPERQGEAFDESVKSTHGVQVTSAPLRVGGIPYLSSSASPGGAPRAETRGLPVATTGEGPGSARPGLHPDRSAGDTARREGEPENSAASPGGAPRAETRGLPVATTGEGPGSARPGLHPDRSAGDTARREGEPENSAASPGGAPRAETRGLPVATTGEGPGSARPGLHPDRSAGDTALGEGEPENSSASPGGAPRAETRGLPVATTGEGPGSARPGLHPDRSAGDTALGAGEPENSAASPGGAPRAETRGLPVATTGEGPGSARPGLHPDRSAGDTARREGEPENSSASPGGAPRAETRGLPVATTGEGPGSARPGLHPDRSAGDTVRSDTGESARPITLRIWDFGGQDIYHGTHALFLKSRAIFPVVWNPESEALKEHEHGGFKFRNQPLGYWVEYVRRLGGQDAPLLIVQSQTDKVPPVSLLRMGEYLAADALDGVRFQRMLAYSAATNDGRPGLDAAIAEAADFVRRTQGVGKTGIARAEVKRRLEDMAAGGLQLMEWQDYLTLCEQVQAEGHGTISSPRDLVGYLHNIGSVFWRAGLFDNQLILDQAWVLQNVYAVFDREEATFKSIERTLGRFTVSDLARTVWKDSELDERELFVEFMETCGVCFALREGNAALDIETEYVAPDLLPPRTHPAIAYDVAQMWDEALPTETAELAYDLLPPGLLRTFMAKIGKGAGLAGKYWREGFYFFDQETGARALVEERRPEESWRGDLVIATQKGGADVLLRRLLQMVEEDRIGLGARPREVRIGGKAVARDEKREGERATIAPAHERREGKQRFVSYAWGDDTDDGKERTRLVEQLCAEAERRGKPITRDKDSIEFSDSISTFMDRMIKAAADDDSLIYVLLTDAYLKRPNPMKELWGVWDSCHRHPEIFKARTKVFVHSSARIGSPLERAQHANDWLRKYDEMEAGIARLGTASFAPQDVTEHMRSNHFVRQTPNILYYFHDTFAPRDFDEFLKYGFED